MADMAVMGIMPEQVAAALQGNAARARRLREPVLAGVDARTARAYTCVLVCVVCSRSRWLIV